MDLLTSRSKMFRQARTLATMSAKAKQKAGKAGAQFGQHGRGPDFGGAMTSAEKRMTALLRPVAPPPPKSEEEKARLRTKMIQYGKLKRAQHLEMEARMRNFMRAKWAAIDALPNYRRVEAMNTAPTQYPRNRPMFTDTPPIKGFNSGDITKPS